MISQLRNPNFKNSLIRNSLVQIIWWIFFFPGFFSGDSFAAVQMAKSGELTNSFTASWALYVRLFSFHGKAIGLLTLINGLILVFAVTRFSYAIFSEKSAAISSFLLTLTPVVVGMGITLWHDILMTAGLLLVVTFMTNLYKSKVSSRSEVYWDLILGSVLITFRPNGLPTLLVFSVIFVLFNRSKKWLKAILASTMTVTAVTFLCSNLILGLTPINNYFAQEWMRNDISCFANTAAGAGFVEANIPNIGNTEAWQSEAACTFLNNAELTTEQKIRAQDYVPSAWFKLLKTEPLFIFETHLKRNAYLNPIPIFGIPSEPFLHSTVEFQDKGIKWAFPKLAEAARAPMRVWNALQGITGWAGMWWLITFVLLIKSKNRLLLPALLMSFSLLGILFIFAPIPDARYALFVLIIAQLALIGKLVEWAQTGSNRRPTD